MFTLVSLLARGATRRAQLLLCIPTLDLSLTAATGRLLRFLLTGLTPASPGALRSTRQQVTITVFREAITAPRPCCGCIHCGELVHALFLRSEKGCSVTQHQVSARQSACTHEKDDLTTSRFVRCHLQLTHCVQQGCDRVKKNETTCSKNQM